MRTSTSYIWHYAGGTWSNVPGLAASIAAGPDGTLYAVNAASGGVYAYNGSTWSALGGGADWVTAAADGAVYVLSNGNVVDGNSAIWKYFEGAWTQQPGAGAKLAGSSDSTLYALSGSVPIAPDGYFVVNATGGLYYYSPGTGYAAYSGSASFVAPTLGGVFALGYPSAASGEQLFYFDYYSLGWTAESGSAVSLAAGPGPSGTGWQLYAVNSAGAIWTTVTSAAAGPKIFVAGEANTVSTFASNGAPSVPTITAGLNQPSGIAVDAAGKIYVTNYAGNSLTTYAANGVQISPTIVGLDQPYGVAVDASGKIYVANSGNGTVTTYTANGTQTTPTIAGLTLPTGVAVDATGKIYVPTYPTNTVHTYNADGSAAAPTISVGLNEPVAVAVNPAGTTIFIADFVGSLTPYTSGGSPTSPTITGLNGPDGVALDAAGNIYISNFNGGSVSAGTVQVFPPAATSVPLTIGGLSSPSGVAVH